MDARTGKVLNGVAHLQQSVQDILSTPIGTRVMRRDYGSDVPSIIDQPMTPGTLIDLFAAVAIALNKWEPEFKLSQVIPVSFEPGKAVFDLPGIWLPEGKEIILEGVVV